MNRRSFLTSCAVAAGGASLLASVTAQAQGEQEMKKLAASKLRISVPPHLFKGLPIDQQLERVAAWGAAGYEWLNPEGDIAALRRKADSLGLESTCIVGVGAIEPRQMVDPTDHDRLEAMFRQRIELGKTLGCKRLIGLSGTTRSDAGAEEQTEAMVTFLKRIAPIAEDHDITIVLEALNTLVDHEGYFMTRTDQTMAIIDAVGSPKVKMLFDIYHQQITEGNVIRNFTKHIDRIGHFHFADNPGRHEPGTGELNYTNIFKAIAATNYDGFVAVEFGPTSTADKALEAVAACLNWT